MKIAVTGKGGVDPDANLGILSKIPQEDFLGFIHYNSEIMETDRMGEAPYDHSPLLVEEINKIVKEMEEENKK